MMVATMTEYDSIAIPVNTIIMGDLFSLDLYGPENPNGSLSIAELYKHLLNVRTWGFNNNDPAMAFRRRLWAQEGAEVLNETTVASVSDIAGKSNGLVDRWGKLLRKSPTAHVKEGSLRWYGQHVVKELLAHGKTIQETADIVWLTALAGIGVPVGLVSAHAVFSAIRSRKIANIPSLPMSCNSSFSLKTHLTGLRSKILCLTLALHVTKNFGSTFSRRNA